MMPFIWVPPVPCLDQCCYLCWVDPPCPHTAKLHTRWSLTVTSWAGQGAATLPKSDAWASCLPCNFATGKKTCYSHTKKRPRTKWISSYWSKCLGRSLLQLLHALLLVYHAQFGDNMNTESQAFICCLKNTFIKYHSCFNRMRLQVLWKYLVKFYAQLETPRHFSGRSDNPQL